MVQLVIRNKATNLVMQIEDENQEAGAKIVMKAYDGSKGQRWKFKKGVITSVLNGLALDVDGNINDNGQSIQTYEAHGNPNQHWTLCADDHRERPGNRDGREKPEHGGRCRCHIL